MLCFPCCSGTAVSAELGHGEQTGERRSSLSCLVKLLVVQQLHENGADEMMTWPVFRITRALLSPSPVERELFELERGVRLRRVQLAE